MQEEEMHLLSPSCIARWDQKMVVGVAHGLSSVTGAEQHRDRAARSR